MNVCMDDNYIDYYYYYYDDGGGGGYDIIDILFSLEGYRQASQEILSRSISTA